MKKTKITSLVPFPITLSLRERTKIKDFSDTNPHLKMGIGITTLISIIFLSSCVFLTENRLSQTVDDDSFLNRFPQNQKAIIIFKLNGKKNNKIYLCPQKNITNTNVSNCRSIYATNQYRILMLKPNLYYLFAPPKNYPIFSNNKIKIPEKHMPKKHPTILQIKAGEMAYVGDISLRGEKIVVNDKFESVKKILNGKNSKQKEKLFANQALKIDYLISKYPSIKDRFKKRLFSNSKSKK